MAQSAISFSVLVLKYSFHIIDFDIGFEINACQPEILVSNLNEQFRTALSPDLLMKLKFPTYKWPPRDGLATCIHKRVFPNEQSLCDPHDI